MPHSYLGLTSLKSSITIGDSADDARLRAVLEAVSLQVDEECRRTFRTYQATRYATADAYGRLVLDADLLAVTSLKGDPGGARTYLDVWAPTDYDLEPESALAERQPFWAISARSGGDFAFPVGVSRGVEVVGTWGYWEDLVAVGALAADAGSGDTTVTLAPGHGLEPLQTVLIGSEQMYLTGFSAANVASVERGVNGTTAAAHSSGAAVARYRYPAPVVEATRIQAARLFQRVHAPFGVTGSAELGTTAVISRVDPDVMMLLRNYRSGVGVVV